MSLYVIVHPRFDANQTWVNAWMSDHLIEAIQTTNEIGKACQKAKEAGKRVFVHRCSWGENSPVICCSALVEEVSAIDRSTMLVTFAQQIVVDSPPPLTPTKGQNSYSN
jgi:hypothetical protein